jgi:hypothetical protein
MCICDNILLNVLRMRSVSEKLVEKIKTFSIFSLENCAVYVITWKNNVGSDWHMHIACWIPKAPDTHSEYVISCLLNFYSNNGYTNSPHCSVYTYITCFVFISSQGYSTSIFTGLILNFCRIKWLSYGHNTNFYQDGKILFVEHEIYNHKLSCDA